VDGYFYIVVKKKGLERVAGFVKSESEDERQNKTTSQSELAQDWRPPRAK